jgi:hypothetical protein
VEEPQLPRCALAGREDRRRGWEAVLGPTPVRAQMLVGLGEDRAAFLARVDLGCGRKARS